MSDVNEEVYSMIYHKEKLKDVHPDLVILIEAYGKDNDIIIVDGHRDKEAQDKAYKIGNTRVKYPNSKHNSTPSMAVDIAPTKDKGKTIDWRDLDIFREMGRDILFLSKKMGIKVMWGGDWSQFRDYPHVELV
jgi:peptidoglycan L-alanyl-D-glutamate endopeptidase CwlK